MKIVVSRKKTVSATLFACSFLFCCNLFSISNCRPALEVFAQFPGLTHAKITEEIPLRGSGRLFTRASVLIDGTPQEVILMSYTGNRSDNLNFLNATDFLAQNKIPVPRIINRSLASSTDRSYLLVEDLGKTTLKDRPVSSQEADYLKAIDTVTNLHKIPSDTVDPKALEAPFDQEMYLWEQNDFFRQKVLQGFLSLDAETTEILMPSSEGKEMAQFLASLPQQVVHRDFQSENIIFKDGQVYLIDYQGIRKGRAEYDLASLIFDPYRKLPDDLKERLIQESYKKLKAKSILSEELTEKEWRERYFYPAAIQRLMQAMGAYARLATEEGKVEYLKHLEPARMNLITALREGKKFPELLTKLEAISFSDLEFPP
jgi:hypothetical protein